jgi:hypothetical protein
MTAGAGARRRPAAAVEPSSDPIVAFCEALPLARQVADALAKQGFEPARLSVVGSGEDLPAAHTLDERCGSGAVAAASGARSAAWPWASC